MDPNDLDGWRENELARSLERFGLRNDRFETASGITIRDIYTDDDVRPSAHTELPGKPPFTRGVHASMYRGRDWTRRQVVGLGTAIDANERHRFVISQGQTGLSNDFDLPTITGHDSDHPMSEGEVGRVGVAIDTVEDMHDLVRGLPLDEISISMTINHPAAVLLAMYLVVAEERGYSPEVLRGTLQNDPLKEFFAQKTFAVAPAPSVRLTADVIAYCAERVPQFNPISLCGYQTRDSGGTADQEIGLTFAAAADYIEEVLRRGVDIDDFAPRLSFLMYVHLDFFEEVAKFRAARRLWTRMLRDRFGAKRPESWRFRVHVQGGAALLTLQQPELNIARGAIQALAGAVGGVQSMALSTFDEAYSIPSKRAQRIALRTQQIIAHETGVADVVDPLAGSYFVESLTDEIETRAERWIDRVAERGGMLAAVESGWVESILADQAAAIQRDIETGRRIVVGVNEFTDGNEDELDDVFRVGAEVEQEQLSRLAKVRASRDAEAWQASIERLRTAVEAEENLMPFIIECVRMRASEGEIIGAMNDVWGEYRPSAIY